MGKIYDDITPELRGWVSQQYMFHVLRYGVPLMEFVADRDAMQQWAQTNGQDALPAYRRQINSRSIDNLPALDFE